MSAQENFNSTFSPNKYLQAARGLAKAPLVLKNGYIVDVFNQTISKNDIAIAENTILGIGKYQGEKEIDMTDKLISPGLIDSHVHIESSLLTPTEFAALVIPKGTTSIIADPHEIANVCGLSGIEYILRDAHLAPLNCHLMLPSCVPATKFENSGAQLKAKDLAKLVNEKGIWGLGEVMNYQAVINNKDDIWQKLNLMSKKIIDGHAPDISPMDLNAYLLGGIKTDHECHSLQDVKNKLARGMYIMLREGSAAKNLESLLPAINPQNSQRFLFCTDDRNPQDIMEYGHINNNLLLALKGGLSFPTAIKIAAHNPCICYNLKQQGAIAPGYKADLVVFGNIMHHLDGDFKLRSTDNLDINQQIEQVYIDGELVAKDGRSLFEPKKFLNDFEKNRHQKLSAKVKNAMNCPHIDYDILKIPLKDAPVNIIKVEKNSIITKRVVEKVPIENGYFAYSAKNNLLKLAVIERHNNLNSHSLALVKNFPLEKGAISSTIAHDSHNLAIIGKNDEDMILAGQTNKDLGGGITICYKNKVLASLPLPIAGLMSDLDAQSVVNNLKALRKALQKLGAPADQDPLMLLSFLSLPVVPELKLTDRGLFDFKLFNFRALQEIN